MENVKVTYNGPSREVLVPKAGKTPFIRGVEKDCPKKVALKLNRETWKLPADIVEIQKKVEAEFEKLNEEGENKAQTAPQKPAATPKASEPKSK